MKYQVFDNDKPADEIGFPEIRGFGWKTSKFDTFNEAKEYACKWFDFFAEGLKFELNRPEDYSGYGDKVEIKEVE